MRISIDGQYLILPEDTKVSFDRDSSAFSYDVIKDSISIGLSMSGPENATLIQNAHRIGVANRMSIYACQVEDMGIVIADARILIEQGDVIGSRAVISFSLIMSGFGAGLLDKDLRDIDLGTIGIGPQGSQAKNAKALSEEEEGRVRFPTYFNKEHYDGKNGDWGALHPDGLAFINRYESGAYQVNSETVDNWSSNALCPWPNLYYVLRTAARELGYNISGTAFNVPELRELLIQGERTLDRSKSYKGFEVQKDTLLEFPTDDTYQDLTFETVIHNDHAMFNPLTSEYEYAYAPGGGANHIFAFSGEFFLETTGDAGDVDISVLVEYPSTTIGHHFFQMRMGVPGKWIKFYYDSQLLVDPTDLATAFTLQVKRTNSGVGTVDSLSIRNLNVKIYSKYFQTVNVYAKEIIVSQHVPDITVKQLFTAVRSLGLTVTPNIFSKTIDIYLPIDILDSTYSEALPGASDEYSIEFQPSQTFLLQSAMAIETENRNPYTDWHTVHRVTELYGIGEILAQDVYFWETSTYRFYRSTGDPFAPVEFLFYYLPPRIIGTAGEEQDLSPDIELVPMAFYDTNVMTGASDPEHKWFIPELTEVGSSPAFANGIADFKKLRLAIWRGLYDDGHRTFPFATSFNKDLNGDDVGLYSLNMGDVEFGIGNIQAPLLQFLTEEERITVPCRLTPTQVKNMSLTHPWIHNAKRLAIRSLPVTLDGKAEHIHDIEFTLI